MTQGAQLSDARASPLLTSLAIVAPPLGLLLGAFYWKRPNKRGVARELTWTSLGVLGAMATILLITALLARLLG